MARAYPRHGTVPATVPASATNAFSSLAHSAASARGPAPCSRRKASRSSASTSATTSGGSLLAARSRRSRRAGEHRRPRRARPPCSTSADHARRPSRGAADPADQGRSAVRHRGERRRDGQRPRRREVARRSTSSTRALSPSTRAATTRVGRCRTARPGIPSLSTACTSRRAKGSRGSSGTRNSVPSIGIRPCVVYGPGRDNGLTASPTLAMAAAARGEDFAIAFGGRTQLQLARDTAQVFVTAARAASEGARVFHLGGPRSASPRRRRRSRRKPACR